MSVMQVPRTIAPGLTLGAALSNRTHERPCASFPVTTRRIGFGVSVMLVSPLSLTLAEHCPTWAEANPRVTSIRNSGRKKSMVHLGDRARRPRRMLASYTIFVATIFASLTACLLSPPAWAQGFPNRPIKIVVGPSPDVFARIVGEHLQQAWGQPVIVEPRPGAGGKLAAAAVASADPDGHTLLFATPTYTLNTAMKLASYDLIKEFAPVAIIGLISYALVSHPSVPAKSAAELVAYAKANPGKL